LLRIGLSCIVLVGALRIGTWLIDPLTGPIAIRIGGTLVLCTLGAFAYFLAATLLGLSDIYLLLKRKPR
jgi:hypothetical protein